MEQEDDHRFLTELTMQLKKRGYICLVIGVGKTGNIQGGSELGSLFLEKRWKLVAEFSAFVKEAENYFPTVGNADEKEKEIIKDHQGMPTHQLHLLKQKDVDIKQDGFSSERNVSSDLEDMQSNEPGTQSCNRGKDNLESHKQRKERAVCFDSEVNVVEKFECQSCSRVFINKTELDAHLVLHEEKTIELENTVEQGPGEQKDKYQCGKCHRTFDMMSLLESHRNRVLPCHDKNFRKFSSNYNEIVHYEDRNGKATSIAVSEALQALKTECIICSFKTKNLSNLRRHFIITHCKEKPYKCNYCEFSFKLEYLLNIHLMKIHANRKFSPFKCDLCPKIFASKQSMEFHKVFKCKTRLEKCEICSYEPKNSTDMLTHKRQHMGKKEYKCPHCGRGLASRKNLLQHLDLHLDGTNFECKICGLKFQTRDQRNRHQKSHDESRNVHQCMVCEKTFRHKCSLKYHLLTHSGSKPLVCETCGQAFRKRYRLLAHLQKHSGIDSHHCQVCKKAFPTRESLQTHKQIHNERSHMCDRCGKSFYRRGKLTQHSKIHEKRHACDKCPLKFRTLTDLKQHVKQQHAQNFNTSV